MIKVDSDLVVGMNLTGNHFTFYWSLVWPVVESYWITCLYMFKLLKTTTRAVTLQLENNWAFRGYLIRYNQKCNERLYQNGVDCVRKD